MEQFLKDNYGDDITDLLNEPNDRTHAALQVDLSLLQQRNFDWFHAILENVYDVLPKWNEALFAAQRSIASENEDYLEEGYQIKVNCRVRFVHMPLSDPHFKVPFPNHDQIGTFRDVKGTVTRMSQTKLLEIKRDFVCSKCGTVITVEADYSLMYRFDVPTHCTNVNCKGNMHQKSVEPNPKYCVNYQELKIQEAFSEKNIPPTLIVTLDTDLVDCCQPGELITICGTVERRWLSFNETRCQAIISMRAISLVREQNNLNIKANAFSDLMTMKTEWEELLLKYGELGMRDNILSGNDSSEHKSSDGLHQRGQSHVLMVGDPGLAKSKLLLSAVEIAPRAVHTTGMGVTSAGLTAAAIKEDGEWVLEAGALVLADGGICCIDEFNLMRESDRTSIHEAMEQQTISMAKAGIVCKLNTRCAVLAAANPKNLHAMSEPEGMTSINIGIATPLLSRFDLVFILKDERIPEWDDAISFHLLAQVTTGFQDLLVEQDAEIWEQKKLQIHFAAVKQIQPKMSPIASATLAAYYRKCRSDPLRDQARTTVRLLDSLNRLAEAHARLVFREEVTVIDALVIIRLMESTFGFGRIIKPYDVLKEEMPLGPNQEEIRCILDILDIDEVSIQENETKVPNQTGENSLQNSQKSSNSSQRNSSQIRNTQDKNIENPIETQNPETQNVIKQKTPPTLQIPIQSQKPSTSEPYQFKKLGSQKAQASNVQAVVAMDPDELDQILSFDDNSETILKCDTLQIPPTTNQSTVKQNESQQAMSDDEDLVLSQVLDDVERSQMCEPAPKIPKLDFKRPNRMSLNLSLLKSLKNSNKENTLSSSTTASTSSAHDMPMQNEINTLNRSVRNRIFCTPSDDESSQKNNASNLKLSAKTMNLLNSFKFKETIDKNPQIQQENIAVATKDGIDSQSENDSAYDTMLINSSLSSTNPASCRKTGKTPPLFPPTSLTQTKTDEDNLSFLDSLEF